MSDTQEQLVLQQRHMQQRQILAMMGIEQWVRPESPTINAASIASLNTYQPTFSDADTEQASFESIEPMVEQPHSIAHYDDVDSASTHTDEQSSLMKSPGVESPVTYDFENTTVSASHTHSGMQTDALPPVEQMVAPLVESVKTLVKPNSIAENNNTNSYDSSLEKVAPFDLQGGRYGNWVLMVDIQALNNDSQKLWQNITQALSLSCESTSFPICVGMDTIELANASLAGYVFKIGRSEEVLVAGLTKMPDGLSHPNFTSVPTLDQMLADSTLKRKLWEQLSNQV